MDRHDIIRIAIGCVLGAVAGFALVPATAVPFVVAQHVAGGFVIGGVLAYTWH